MSDGDFSSLTGSVGQHGQLADEDTIHAERGEGCEERGQRQSGTPCSKLFRPEHSRGDRGGNKRQQHSEHAHRQRPHQFGTHGSQIRPLEH